MKPSTALLRSDFPRRTTYLRRVWYPSGAAWQGARHSWINRWIVVGLGGIFAWTIIMPYSFEHEVYYNAPIKPTWYMKTNRQYRDDPLGEKMFAGKEPYQRMPDHH